MNILITGGTGLLGTHLALFLRDKYKVTIVKNLKNTLIDGINSIAIDFFSISDVVKNIETVDPDLIINCAGITNVDLCEKNPRLAHFVNGEIPKVLSKIAYQKSIKFIHISTDHLFDGFSSFYTETSSLAPLNEYAKSKKLGEENVLLENLDALILRTNFMGWGTSSRVSFSDWVIRGLKLSEKRFLATDIFITPLLIEHFIVELLQLIAANASGVYNLCGNDRISKFDLGLLLAKKFNLNQELIVPTSLKALNLYANRPCDMSLSNKKVCAILGHSMPGVEGLIDELFFQEKSGFAELISKI